MSYINKYLNSISIAAVTMTMVVLYSLTTCIQFEPQGYLYFETDAAQSLGGGNYSLKGTLDDPGEEPITQHGFCWSEQQSPTTNGPSTREGQINAAGSFTSTISDLPANTTYYYRAYMITSAGTEYANERSFVTESIAPTVTTSAVTGATETTADGGGNVTDDGGATITARGVCWNTTGTPTTTDPKTTDAGTTGSYASAINGTDLWHYLLCEGLCHQLIRHIVWESGRIFNRCVFIRRSSYGYHFHGEWTQRPQPREEVR